MARARRPRERWRPAPGFPSYEVSDRGQIRTYKGVNQHAGPRKKPRLMRQRIGDDGYMRVTLQDKHGTKRVIATHLLVARAFLGRPGGGLVVRHKDGDRTNPWLYNLEYGTEKQNSEDKLKHGTDARGEKNASSLLSQEEVEQIVDMQDSMTQQDIADVFGISRQAVSDIHRGVTWSYE